MTHLPRIAALVLLAGCFDSQAGGPGLEPPFDVPGTPEGPGRGGDGSFGNAGGTGGGVLDPGQNPDSVGGSGGAGGAAGFPDPTTGSGTDAGDGGVPADGGATHTRPDPGSLSCADLEALAGAELAAAQECSADDTCTSGFFGTGCSDGIFPLCSLAYRSGADVEYLVAIDEAFRAAGCSSGTAVACASCVAPAGASCQAGICALNL